MEIINSILVWAMKKRIHQIELFLKYPHEVQTDWLNKLIEQGAHCDWGKMYEFDSVKTLGDFKNRFPVQDYESLKPYIQKAMKGTPNVLWPGETKWFAKSSGTTQDKSKFIPVTQECLEECHYKGGKDLISLYMQYKPDSRMFTGRGLVLGGSSEINTFNAQSRWGDLSSIIIDNLPVWAEFHRTPSKSIALMGEWEAKLQKMAEVTAKQNITTLAGVPSWTLVLLNKVLEITRAKTIDEVWPNLETYTHGGVSFAPYRAQFEEIFNLPNLSFMETYNASEGFFGIQDQYGDAFDEGLLLMLDYGVFYEFIPQNEIDKEYPATVTLDEVKLDEVYAMVITTNAGLWRYNIGDTVTFTSTNPYRIKIAGRTKQHINVFGEELMIENAEKALQIATTKTNSILTDYTGAPIFMKNKNQGGHEWAFEFKRPPADIGLFTDIFDNALKSLNSDYEAKRYNNYILQPPKINVVSPGRFYNWMKSRGKLGGQNKVPRLSNSRKYIDEILG